MNAQDAGTAAEARAQAAHECVVTLRALDAALAHPAIAALRVHAALCDRAAGVYGGLHAVVAHLLHSLCAAFAPSLFQELLAFHALDVKTGAELPARTKATFLALVTANDQFGDAAHEPSTLQLLVLQEVLETGYSKADMALAVLFKEVTAVRFRAALERILQVRRLLHLQMRSDQMSRL